MAVNNTFSGSIQFTQPIITDSIYNNIGIGYNSLHNGYSNCGQNNIGIGYEAGYNCVGTSVSNQHNILMGYQSGHMLATGCDNNIFLGNQTGYNLSSSSAGVTSLVFGCVYIGSYAGKSNTIASNNVCIGYLCNQNHSGGSDNVFVGQQSGLNNEGIQNTYLGSQAGAGGSDGGTGKYNTFVGFQSGYSITSGYYNTFSGFQSGKNNTTGSNNTFIGTESGQNNTTGNSNCAIGMYSMFSNTSGQTNTGLGIDALYYCTTSNDNVAVGYNAGLGVTTATGKNTMIGTNANSTFSNCTCLGYGATSTADNQVVLGTASEAVIVAGSMGLKADGTDSIYFTSTAGGFNSSTGGFLRIFCSAPTTVEPSAYTDFYYAFYWRSSNKTNSSATSVMQLGATGNLFITGALTQNSDYRIKKRLGDAQPVLERLCNVDMFTYELNGLKECEMDIFKSTGNKVGFYAHDLQEKFPEIDTLVSGEKDAVNEDGTIKTQSVDTFQLTNVLMKAIQELNALVKAQQIQIDYLTKNMSV